MTDEERPPPDEPTRAYRPIDDEATRLERPIVPYDESREPAAPTIVPSTRFRQQSIIAPLITVSLLSILAGIGIGWVLFNESDASTPEPTTTVPVPSSTTTTQAPSTTTTTASTTTTRNSTTTSTIRSTTTTRPTTTTSSSTTTTALG